MVGCSCFCGGREPAQEAVRRSAKVLKGVADLGGAKFADQWLQTAGAADARFNCGPS